MSAMEYDSRTVTIGQEPSLIGRQRDLKADGCPSALGALRVPPYITRQVLTLLGVPLQAIRSPVLPRVIHAKFRPRCAENEPSASYDSHIYLRIAPGGVRNIAGSSAPYFTWVASEMTLL